MIQYYDIQNSPHFVFSVGENPLEIICTGILAIPIGEKEKRLVFQKFLDDYAIALMTKEMIPEIQIYTVPYVLVMARTDDGGYIVALDEDGFSSKRPICYISEEGECYQVASNGKNFLKGGRAWRESRVPYKELRIFASREEAEKEYDILDYNPAPMISKEKSE